MPAERVSGIPFGLGFTKPHNYWEVVRTAWQNKRNPLFTWRILRDGVCDGCALGTTGMRDFTMKGIHLCTVRLNLLPLNTMGPLDTRILEDVGRLRSVSSRDLRALGRLPYPMLRRRGDPGFHRISWDEAFGIAARRIRTAPPDRIAFFITSRGMTNESYYVANKVARFLGTNHIDNSSRPCHSPSTTGLKDTIGVAASTCSYSDWIGSDLVVFFGSDVPNNQPVTTKYLYYAKKQGAKVAVVNPFREPGLERYWVPSVFDSAFFGTRLADAFFQIHTGGDVAFINGVMKHLIAEGWIDDTFIAEHTTGFEALRETLDKQLWDVLEKQSGCSKEEMRAFAEMYGKAKTAVFVWSMGITQHVFGADNVKAIMNLALARGMVGREKCGVMPGRGPRMCGRPWNGCPCASTRTWSLRRRCSWTRPTSWSSSQARHGTSNGAAGPRPRPSAGSTSPRKSGATRLAKAGPNGKSSWTWPSGFGPTPRSISTSAMPRRSGKRSRRSFRCTTEFSGSRRRATRSNGAGPVCAKAGDSRIRTDGRVSAPFGRRPATSLRAGSS